MPQRKLLLDTNAYLRLARSVHPLLFSDFGEDRICLYLNNESASSRRSWTVTPERAAVTGLRGASRRSC